MIRSAQTMPMVLLAALALAGCGSTSSVSEWISGKPAPVEANLFPAAFKAEILNTLGRTLDDPTNVREAGLSDPKLERVGTEDRYVACVRFNARDINKQYTGVKMRAAYFFGGHLNQLIEAPPEQCARAAYKPFPELEKLCLSEKCS